MHQLLSQLGIKITFRWSRSVMGYEGQKIRVYRIDTHHWGKLHAILERRLAKREDLAEVEGNTLERYPPIPIAGSPTALDLDLIGAGDPTQHFPSAAAPLVAQPSLLDLDRNALLHPPNLPTDSIASAQLNCW